MLQILLRIFSMKKPQKCRFSLLCVWGLHVTFSILVRRGHNCFDHKIVAEILWELSWPTPVSNKMINTQEMILVVSVFDREMHMEAWSGFTLMGVDPSFTWFVGAESFELFRLRLEPCNLGNTFRYKINRVDDESKHSSTGMNDPNVVV